ncbi:MAG: nuclear transport factor 2 family protein [Deltaproteobacteria bacterium]|nr:nuclear transport factor 2 family protein [Deltaproteobacteria bacterium]MBW2362666.1 nuclear transport factor 2 family protein [Deltaproteobacteria bacterium]
MSHPHEEIAAIERLKYRYFRCVDTKAWEELREVLTEDCVSWYDSGRHGFEGSEAMIAFLTDALPASIVSMHHAHHPEIELTSDTTARGCWYLHDYVVNDGTGHPSFPDRTELHGSALIEEEYRKVDGHWRISRTGYERIFEDLRPLPEKHSFRSRWS